MSFGLISQGAFDKGERIVWIQRNATVKIGDCSSGIAFDQQGAAMSEIGVCIARINLNASIEISNGAVEIKPAQPKFTAA